MTARTPLETWSVTRKLTVGYGAATVVLLAALALRVPSHEAWLWLSLVPLLSIVVSLRSALVFAHRKELSRPSWRLRPTSPVESELGGTWLVYAVVFGAASLVVFFL